MWLTKRNKLENSAVYKLISTARLQGNLEKLHTKHLINCLLKICINVLDI